MRIWARELLPQVTAKVHLYTWAGSFFCCVEDVLGDRLFAKLLAVDSHANNRGVTIRRQLTRNVAGSLHRRNGRGRG